jgi:hypothetical protein
MMARKDFGSGSGEVFFSLNDSEFFKTKNPEIMGCVRPYFTKK